MPGKTVSEGPVCAASELEKGIFGQPPGQEGGPSPARLRKSGLDFLGDIPWGTHLCQFYHTKEDFTDIVLPFLRAGLENNEFCIWVATDLIDPAAAQEAMADGWPACQEYVDRGQMRFLDHNGWYYRQGPFEPAKMVENTLDIVGRAIQNEYEGMRIASGMSWFDECQWGLLAEFERNLTRLDSSHPLLSICSYNFEKCSPAEVIELFQIHGSAILRRENRWEVLRAPAKSVVIEKPLPAEAPPASAASKAPTDAEEQMQVVFEGVRDAIVILDMAGKIIRVNKRVPELFGYTESAVVGKQFALLRMFPPSRAAEMFSAQARTLAGHDVPPFDIEANAESGQKLDVEVRISPMKRESKVVGAVAVIRDITMRRQAEEKLRAAQQRNQLVVQNASEGIMVIQDGAIKFANPKMIELIGFSEDETLGKPVTDLVHPDDRRAVTAGQFKRLRGEELSHVQDLRVVDKKGNTKWAEFNAVLFAWDGRPADLYFVNDITQRKQAQDGLIQGERNYKQLFESTLEGLEVVDTETGKVVLANPACAAIFGFDSPAGMIGTDPLQYISEEDRERMGAMLAGSAAGGSVHKAEELRAITRSGGEVRIGAVCVMTEFQRRPAAMVSLKDITGQRRAEEQLSQSQTDLQVVFDGVLEAIVLFDGAGRVVRVNKRVIDLSELPPEEILGQEFDALKMFTAESAAAIRSAVQAQLSGKDVGHFELEGRNRSGQGLSLEARIATLGQGEAVLGGIAVLRDVSYRKEAEDRLRRQERYFRALIESTSDAITVIDRDGRVKYQSPTCERVLGYKPMDADRLAKLSIFDYVHPDDREGMREHYQRLAGTVGGSERAEARIRHQDGTWRMIEASSNNLLDDPDVAGIVITLRDVTERREADTALKESEKRYRILAENASDVIWIMDMDLKFTYVSPSTVRLVGYTPEEVLTRQTLQPFVTPACLDSVTKALAEELANEGKPSMDPQRSRLLVLEMISKDTGTVWVEIKASFLRDAGGKPIGVLGVARDITERRKTLRSLEESEKRYRLLAENVNDVIWTMDKGGRLTYVSPSVSRLSGYSVDEAMAMPIREAFAPESAAKVKKSVRELPQAGSSTEQRRDITTELELKRKDGSTTWTETSMSPVLGPDGAGVGWIGMTRDITERRRAAQQQLDSEKKYRLLAENIWDVIWVTDLNLKPKYISPSMERLLGYTVEESMASGLEKMVTRESAREATERMAKATSFLRKDSGKPFKPGSMELELKRKDGSTTWMETTVNVVRDSSGKPVEFMGVLRDITERKKSEKAVSDSEGRFRSLIESTSDWVWEVSDKLVYTYVSRKIHDILGYEPEEVIGKAPVDLMPLKEANRVARVFDTALTEKKPFAFVENVCLHKDGHKVVLETSGVPFFDANGNVLGFRGMNRDVTERKKAEEEAQESFRKLQRTVEGTIQAIALTVETRDPYTAGHQRRVTKLAYAIAREMSLPNDQIQRVRISGLLHDLGKIFIPTEILSKPGQLTEVEFAIIKSHPQAGHEILKNIEFPWPISDIVIQHHERMNGSGYPAGLKGDEIVIEARILAVADVVEAMSSHRPYRPAIGLEKALKEIVNNKGILYDASVVEACMRVFGGGAFKFDD